ncbi:MAG TPA: hypothetical protein VFJ58_28790 [Armatimonadota bacterium]|nr:hypothetical protein [Armatimonadota bacterium]
MKLRPTTFLRVFAEPVLTTMLLALPIAAVVGGCARVPKAPTVPRGSTSRTLAKWRSIGVIRLGDEKPGLRLDAAVTPWIPSSVILRANYHGKTWLVDNLNELNGLLRITDPDTALKYVRFCSDIGGGWLWHSSCGGCEIVDAKTYRLSPCWNDRPNLFYDQDYPDSGMLGILSVRAFRAGGFCLPSVQRATDGFVIERWVFLWGDNPVVQRIREFVGRDGSYRWVVEKQMPAPKLPATHWAVLARR